MTESQNQSNQLDIDWNKTINRLVLIIGIGILINLAFNYFISGEFQLKELLGFSPFSLFLAFILAVSPWVAHAIEIIIWTDFFKNKVSFKEALRISIATDLGSAITPTMVGGAPIKLGMLMRKGLSSGQSAAMIMFNGIEDLCFFLLMIPISIIFSDRIGVEILNEIVKGLTGKLSTMLIVAASFLVICGILFYLFKKFSFGDRIRGKIRASLVDFKEAMTLIAKNGKTAFLLATFAICTRWITRFFILISLINGFGVVADLTEVYLSEWLVYMGMTVTPTPGAIGGAEGTFYLVYRPLIPQDVIGPIMFAWRFFNYYLLLILSALFLNLTNKWRQKKIHKKIIE